MKKPLSIEWGEKIVQYRNVLLYKYLFAVDNVYPFLGVLQAFAGNVVYLLAFVLWGRGNIFNAGGVAEAND